MSINETRYGIIIGVDDYDQSPLSFCVNDANSIEDALINNCLFKKENIFKITSSNDNSEKDITGKYLAAIRKIKEKFNAGEDSIFFYFAGHGYCQDNKSMICLHQSPYPITDIFENISSLKPRVQMYMIDSCQSGSKVLTRGKDDKLNKYISSAEGAMFLYACDNTQSASEIRELQHGRLTHYILEAINDKSLYDDSGYLTFNRIVDFVQKKTIDDSEFNQTPVVENRISSYYPFAVDNNNNLLIQQKEDRENITSSIKYNDLSNPRKLKDLRAKLQVECKRIVETEFNNIDLSKELYEKASIENLENLEYQYSGIKDLEKCIVNYVEKEKLTPLKNIIYKKIEKKDYSNPLMGGWLKSIDVLNNTPTEVEYNIIEFNDEKIDSEFNLCISNDINNVSFGVGYINYQAKWGIVILTIVFLIDWDGECDSDIKNIKINHIAISLEEESLARVDEININISKYIEENLQIWNKERRLELDKYRLNSNN